VSDFEQLSEFESRSIVTIGLHRNAANNFWYGTSLAGKYFNLGTWALVVVCVFLFLTTGWKVGCISVLALLAYVSVVNWLCLTAVRFRMLREAKVFDLFYSSGAATIRVNETGEIIRHPADWRLVLGKAVRV